MRVEDEENEDKKGKKKDKKIQPPQSLKNCLNMAQPTGMRGLCNRLW
jgi:hypothetical protein